MRPPILLLIITATIAHVACGTVVYDHRIDVAIQDPSGRLGPSPIPVSVFDRTMGSSEEWAQRWIGSTAPGAVYAGKVSATATKMFVPYGVPSESARSFVPLPARFRSEFSDKGWLIHLSVDVPPDTKPSILSYAADAQRLTVSTTTSGGEGLRRMAVNSSLVGRGWRAV